MMIGSSSLESVFHVSKLHRDRTYRGVEQLVARWAHNPKVTGSSPVPATVTPGNVRGFSF